MRKLTLIALLLALALAGCAPAWQLTLTGGDAPVVFDAAAWKALAEELPDPDREDALRLEQVLWEAGFPAVERVAVGGTSYDWNDLHDSAWLTRRGALELGEAKVELGPASELAVTPPALLAQAEASITDIAPTIAQALGVPAPAQATGRALTAERAPHVALVYLDGFGYLRYQEARAAGWIPNLAALGEPLCALTVYPSATRNATAALLTGAPPIINGVRDRDLRTTEAETILDVLKEAGRSNQVVEGNALAFNLRNATFKLSGDVDGDENTDDEVLANTLAVLEGGMPDLLFAHFHGIDDAGHGDGPDSPVEIARIQEADRGLGEIIQRLPSGTLLIVFADHGMRAVQEDERQGNHGTLLARDMFIPIILYRCP